MKSYLRVTSDNKNEWIANRFNATTSSRSDAEALQKKVSDATKLEEIGQAGAESKWVVYKE